MKTKHILKNVAYCILAILFLCIISTYFVGSYFIDFALVPNKGGEARDSSNASSQKELEGYEPLSEDLKVKIELAKKQDSSLFEEWIKKVEKYTKAVSITSKDGLKLVGTEFTHPYSLDNWVIVVHGYQSSEAPSKKIARHYYNRGFNVLTISLRAHGDSEGKYIGMGVLDSEDLFLWTSYIVKQNENARIVYHGTSMGSATVLFASSMNIERNVKAIIADCGYTSVWEVFENELKNRFGLPTFPILYMTDIMGRLKAGYSIKNASTLEEVKKSHIPILFIHTTSDDFVPVSMVYSLYAAHNGKKDLYIVKGANHTEAKYVNMDAYYSKIMSFIQSVGAF